MKSVRYVINNPDLE